MYNIKPGAPAPFHRKYDNALEDDTKPRISVNTNLRNGNYIQRIDDWTMIAPPRGPKPVATDPTKDSIDVHRAAV